MPTVACGVKLTTTILVCAYDLGVKGQCQILNIGQNMARNAIPYFVFVIFITMIVLMCTEITKEVSDNCYDLGVKCQGRIYLKPVCGS